MKDEKSQIFNNIFIWQNILIYELFWPPVDLPGPLPKHKSFVKSALSSPFRQIVVQFWDAILSETSLRAIY